VQLADAISSALARYILAVLAERPALSSRDFMVVAAAGAEENVQVLFLYFSLSLFLSLSLPPSLPPSLPRFTYLPPSLCVSLYHVFVKACGSSCAVGAVARKTTLREAPHPTPCALHPVPQISTPHTRHPMP